MTQVQLHPFDLLEASPHRDLQAVWNRGGYPQSLLAASDDESRKWRLDYIESTIQKDALTARSRVSARDYRNLLALLADRKKDAVNKSVLASGLGLSVGTVGDMLAVLEEMMLIARLPAYVKGVSRRIARTPKCYFCDSGIFHCMINRGVGDLQGIEHGRLRGASWEGMVVANLTAVLPRGWCPYFFKPHSAGNEVDLLLQKPGGGLWAVEIKSGQDVLPDRKFLKPLRHLAVERIFVVHGGQFRHRDIGNVEVVSLAEMMNQLLAQETQFREPESAAGRIVDPDSSFSEVVRALNEADDRINLRRARFLRHCSGQFERMLRSSPGLHDRQTLLMWERMRNQLLQWLDLESVLNPELPGAEVWLHRLADVLEDLQGMRSSAPDSAAGADDSLGGTCLHELFVHALAVLMRNKCFAAFHHLAARKYYLHGRMLASSCFSLPGGNPGIRESSLEPSGNPESGVVEDSAIQVQGLAAAELLLVLHGIVAGEGRDSKAADGEVDIWVPGIALIRRIDAPAFFVRAQERAGAEDLLACLGLPADATGMAKLRRLASSFFAAGEMHDGVEWSRVALQLNFEKWHDLA